MLLYYGPVIKASDKTERRKRSLKKTALLGPNSVKFQ